MVLFIFVILRANGTALILGLICAGQTEWSSWTTISIHQSRAKPFRAAGDMGKKSQYTHIDFLQKGVWKKRLLPIYQKRPGLELELLTKRIPSAVSHGGNSQK
jgi:hypothetical protein